MVETLLRFPVLAQTDSTTHYGTIRAFYKYANGGYEFELLVVFTGASDDLDYAIMKAYNVINDFSFEELYYRDYNDFICEEYDNNIMERIKGIESLISSPESEDEPK